MSTLEERLANKAAQFAEEIEERDAERWRKKQEELNDPDYKFFESDFITKVREGIEGCALNDYIAGHFTVIMKDTLSHEGRERLGKHTQLVMDHCPPRLRRIKITYYPAQSVFESVPNPEDNHVSQTFQIYF